MARSTIDFGIYLGAMESAAAVFDGKSAEMIPNSADKIITPTVVWTDETGAMAVGEQARQQRHLDPDNAVTGFRSHMGLDTVFQFARTGQAMTPQGLSAAVLKSLRDDIGRATNEAIRASVITIPVDFGLAQNRATQEAAKQAGFTQSPLLSEPVAAAMAYEMHQASADAVWMIYELAAGAFDVTVLRLRKGQIQPIAHGWDNYVGGGFFDWAVIDGLIVPALAESYPLTEFQRKNPEWYETFARLKLVVEEARPRWYTQAKTKLTFGYLGEDDEGELIRNFTYTVTAEDVARLLRPYIQRTVKIGQGMLQRKQIPLERIERVVLAGAPTVMPFMRDMLADSEDGFGLPLEHSLDPEVVIAQGAARFASTLPLKPDSAPLSAGVMDEAYVINFPDWKFSGNDEAPLAAGIVVPPQGQAASGLKVEFVNTSMEPEWHSPQVDVVVNGMFMTTLVAEKTLSNTYRVSLWDSVGNPLRVVTNPIKLFYKMGVSGTASMMTKSVGIVMPDDEVMWLFTRGTMLPAHTKCTLKTTVDTFPGEEGFVIYYKLVEGDSPSADANHVFGVLKVPASELTGPVPAGSEIKLSVLSDEDRNVDVNAYIPYTGQRFESIVQHEEGVASGPGQVRTRLDVEVVRLERIRAAVAGFRPLGLKLEDDRIDWFYQDGMTLPAEIKQTHKIEKEFVPEDGETVFQIMVVEGKKKELGEWSVMGKLELRADQVEKALSAGSVIDITLHIDSNRKVWGKATLPESDQPIDILYLAQKAQLIDPYEDVRRTLDRIEHLRLIPAIEEAIEALYSRPAAAADAERYLLDLKMALDEAEELMA